MLSNIQFHWQFLITYSGFWLVNILLLKFDTSSNKEMRMIKIHFLDKTKKCQESICKYKVAFFILWTHPTDPWCNMLKKLEIRRKYSWKEIVSGTHSQIINYTLPTASYTALKPFMPWYFNFVNRISWLTVSKAFDRSIKNVKGEFTVFKTVSDVID